MNMKVVKISDMIMKTDIIMKISDMMKLKISTMTLRDMEVPEILDPIPEILGLKEMVLKILNIKNIDISGYYKSVINQLQSS